MTVSTTAEPILEAGAITAESPVWDERDSSLLWVDVHSSTVHRLALDGSCSNIWVGQARVGFVAPTEDDGLVVGVGDRVLRVSRTEEIELWRCQELVTGGRFNDGKADHSGRLWAGTMAQDEEPGMGSLYRFTAGSTAGAVNVRSLIRDVTVSNGLAWTADGRTMYYVDSATRRVDAFDFDRDNGELHNRREFVYIDGDGAEPDGITIDAEGFVWVAVWGGWEVRRYTPRGKVDTVVRLPVQYPTSCTLGGPDLRDLYITTSSFRVPPQQRSSQPHAGDIFCHRASAPGFPVDRVAF